MKILCINGWKKISRKRGKILNIRKGIESDIAELQKKFKTARGMTINSLNSNYLYVYEYKEEIIAFLYGDKAMYSNFGILLGIEVLKDYRHKGIATNLIKQFEEDLKRKNCRTILLFCNNDNGQLEFYRKVGFKREDTLFAVLKEIE